jgi:hypothetical protein
MEIVYLDPIFAVIFMVESAEGRFHKNWMLIANR